MLITDADQEEIQEAREGYERQCLGVQKARFEGKDVTLILPIYRLVKYKNVSSIPDTIFHALEHELRNTPSGQELLDDLRSSAKAELRNLEMDIVARGTHMLPSESFGPS